MICLQARAVEHRRLQLPLASTVADALVHVPHWRPGLYSVGVWGRLRPTDWPLCEGDRVEVYRPLAMEPMAARRHRHALNKKAKRVARTE